MPIERGAVDLLSAPPSDHSTVDGSAPAPFCVLWSVNRARWGILEVEVSSEVGDQLDGGVTDTMNLAFS